MGGSSTTKIPNFSKYRSSGGETNNRVFQYFMVGTMGAVSALGAKATVQGESIGDIMALQEKPHSMPLFPRAIELIGSLL
jgi:hypothetical protein